MTEYQGTLTVAIDGPAGSGKSSVAREVATRLGFGILDTGAAYRALAWVALQGTADLDTPEWPLLILDHWTYETTLVGQQRIVVQPPGFDETPPRAVDVTAEIRDPHISAQVSRISKHQPVRDRLNEMFRRIIADSGLPGVVVEGRDVTTVITPDAPVRILLTASPEARAARRAGELPGMSEEQVLADLAERDAKDALVVDFFHPAPGVTFLDTTDLNFEGSVQAVIDIVRAAQKGAR